MKKYSFYLISLVLGAFALLTLFLSSSVIFDLFDIRTREGNYVPFVVWANFISSFLYLAAVYGFLKQRKWTFYLLMASTVILFLAFIGLNVHANSGGIYEVKTMKAMIFRTSFTLVFALIAFYTINKHLKNT